MRKIKLHRVALLLVIGMSSATAIAQTQYIKYKKYLVPIGGSAIQVLTQPATAVSGGNATLNLLVERSENPIDVWFDLSVSDTPDCGQQAASNAVSRSEGEPYSQSLSGLNANTTYFFRACGSDNNGNISSGDVLSFTTTNASTVVSVAPASGIAAKSAILNGVITSGTNIEAWFRIGTNTALNCGTPDNVVTNSGNSGDVVSQVAESLVPNTFYYYKLCGLGFDGVRTSGLRSFRTDRINTSVSTIPPTSIFESTADLRGEITSGYEISTWFVYGTSTVVNCGSPNSSEILGGNTGDARTLTVESLTPDTRYYYRFCGKGSDGTKSGSRLTFVTQQDPTSIGFPQVGARSATSATVSGQVEVGQNVNTWFVAKELGQSISCNSTPRYSEQLLDAGQTNTHTLSGLDDWTTHTVLFCGQSQAGTLDSSAANFRTKRALGQEYFVNCNDSVVYRSENGPLKFYVDTPDPAFAGDDHATFTVNNFGSSRQYLFQSRATASGSGTLPSGQVTIAIEPAFTGISGNNRFYRLEILGSASWTATVGCITEDILRKAKEPSE